MTAPSTAASAGPRTAEPRAVESTPPLAGPGLQPPSPGMARDLARRADQRRLSTILNSEDPAEIAERDALLERINRPVIERLLSRPPSPLDRFHYTGVLAAVGARSRAALKDPDGAYTSTTQETHA